MKYSFPTGNIYVSLFVIIHGLYALIRGKMTIGDKEFLRDDQLKHIRGTRARIWAIILVLTGSIASYDLLLFIACFFSVGIAYNLSNQNKGE